VARQNSPNFMRVTRYTTPMYVVDFTRALNFVETQGSRTVSLWTPLKPQVLMFW
jgi:hypothetical protein